jgi:hypothetical protein
MVQPTATSKRRAKIAAEFWLLWEILRRWPRGYSLGEYLHAVEQYQIRLRARRADDRPSLFSWAALSGTPRPIQSDGC